MATSYLRAFAGAAAAAVLFLSGCSSTSESDTSGGAGGDLPEASGEFGDAPEFTWPGNDPSGELEVQVLHEGEGPEVAEGASVVANYAGHVWGEEEPFDSSYQRGEPSYFPLEGVVAGWREGIPGHPLGSRLLISIPPEHGYGAAGQPGAGIEGDDTIVFVVDLIESFDQDSLGEADAKKVELPADVPVTVEGDLGEQFTVAVEEGADEPAESQAYALSRGSGEKVEAGETIVVAYALTSWDNEMKETSWMPELGPQAGPQSIPVGAGTALDLIEGFEVGSRVLITQAPVEDMPAVAIVADVIAAY